MAIGRILSKRISLSRQVDGLSSDLSRLAFTWTIAHLDRDGRTYGDPGILKSFVFPRRTDITKEMMKVYIDEWTAAELIILYEVGGDLFIEFPEFRKNQPNLRYDREPESVIPPSSKGKRVAVIVAADCRKDGGNKPAEVKLIQVKGNLMSTSSGDDPEIRDEDVPESLKTILAVLKTEYAIGLHVSDLALLDQLKRKAYPSVICEQLRKVKRNSLEKNKQPPALPIHYIHSYMKDWKKTMTTDDIKRKQSDDSTAWTCGECGEKYRSTSTVCVKCGWTKEETT